MENQLQKMSDIFNEYGIRISAERIKEIDTKVVKQIGKNMNLEKYEGAFLECFRDTNDEKIFWDFSLTVEKLGLGKNYKQLPEWFTEELQIRYVRSLESFTIIRKDIRFKFAEPDFFSREDMSYFEENIIQENGREYELRKLFDEKYRLDALAENIRMACLFVEDGFYSSKKMKEMTERLLIPIELNYYKRVGVIA